MANVKFSEIAASGTALTGATDVLMGVRSATTDLTWTPAQVATYMWASPTLVTPTIGVATGTSLVLSGSSPQLMLGVNTTTLGGAKFFGSTSGDVTVKAAAVAGTATVFQLPATNGTNTWVLTTDGSGVTSWAAPGSTANLVIGTSTISSGTNTRVLFDDSGVVGEDGAFTFTKGTGFLTASGLTLTSVAANTPTLVGSGFSLTGSDTHAMIDLAGTWNTSGVANGIKLVLTDTAHAALSRFIDVKAGSNSVFTAGFLTANSSSLPTLWLGSATPSSTNYLVLENSGSPEFQGASAINFTIGGASDHVSITSTFVKLASTVGIAWTSSTSTGTSDTFVIRTAAATVQYGATNVDTNATIVAQKIRTQGALAGGTSDQAGKDFTFIVSPGKGTGVGGKFIIQTTPAGSTGTTVNTATTQFTVDGPGNVVLGNAAIATSATDGDLCIVTCAGSPSGTPTSFTGRVHLRYDTTNHQLWVYDGAWLQPKTPAGAAIVTWQ